MPRTEVQAYKVKNYFAILEPRDKPPTKHDEFFFFQAYFVFCRDIST